MDWKNHIVADTSAASLAKSFAPYATEEFLVTLANKGLYKRALKDIDIIPIEIAETDGGLQVNLGEATVTLQPNVSQSTCSCPSKTVCKHVLMAIMAAATCTGDKEEEAPPIVPEKWKLLKEADITALRKQAGKKLFDDSFRLIQDGWTAHFTEGDMLAATINTENITVYFPPEDSIAHAICKCGNPDLCKHKLIAILSYLSKHNRLPDSGEDTGKEALLTGETKTLLESADKWVVGILSKGIISCGENESETAIQYAIRLETSGIGNLARMFRSLSSDLENMMAKHVGFSQTDTFSTLSRLHNTMRLILRNAHDSGLLSKLIEGVRSDYYTIPVGTFTGLGASPWQTRSGYFGLTAWLFYHEKQCICTYTVSMADYYAQTEELATLDNLTRRYNRNNHWQNNISLAGLSQSSFVLRNFKMNRQLRLSSSNQTQCELTKKISAEDIETFKAHLPLFNTSAPIDTNYAYFGKKRQEQIILIPFTHLKEVNFNPVEQKLHFILPGEGEEGSPIEVTIDFNPFTQEAIKYLERLGNTPGSKCRYMVCLKRANGFTPVSIISDKGIDNIFFNT
jgi:hypothetical protein